MRILIAEEDPKLLKSLVHIFEMNHYAVDGVDNGNGAFDFASSDEYDGLVLDIMMPGMDGVSLLKRLRANGITTPALYPFFTYAVKFICRFCFPICDKSI